MTDLNGIPTAMSTSALESKLRSLKEKSNKHSQVLTGKLATSQSGQNLLHIGTSLSTLPPDLHSLLTQLHPVLSSAESTEKQYLQHLEKLVHCGSEIRMEERRVLNAKECATLYQDLMAAEIIVKKDASCRNASLTNNTEDEDGAAEKVDRISSLERCAHTTLCLIQGLQSSTDMISAMTAANVASVDSSNALPSMRTPLEDDTEKAQFLMKLAPSIRRLESDTIISLAFRMEETLKVLQQRREGRLESKEAKKIPQEDDLLLMLGHCMRGLALLGRGKEVESIFARVAIMPLIRSKVSMGSLDEGGSRGECAGLFRLLDNMASSISQAFGPVLQLADVMFDVGSSKMEVDLITAGVWVPIATALMADAGIKMAIFSPGIANILQANYLALDTFLSELAERLLKQSPEVAKEDPADSLLFRPTTTPETIRRAQNRIYAHPKTSEFSKRWNLPIYYQLRFGECCTRMNKAIEETKEGGWITEVYSGEAQKAEHLKNQVGFELPFFLELYDILLSLWKTDVILRPLTNRFLRGSVQLVGRIISFIEDGIDGKIKFGLEPAPAPATSENGAPIEFNGTSLPPTRLPYCWADSAQDVAAVAWELAILETSMGYDYVTTVVDVLGTTDSTKVEDTELRSLVQEVLKDSSDQIRPLVDRMWNEVIVKIVTEKCSGPLAAVKGVAATYRMTNRPPPTQASPFVATILRPLKEFSTEFSHRKPDYIGDDWKKWTVSIVTERYSAAVEELLTTVQRTEVALQSRRARRVASGGISDGDKVRLQSYLDVQEFFRLMEEAGVNPASIEAVAKLKILTVEAKALIQQNGN